MTVTVNIFFETSVLFYCNEQQHSLWLHICHLNTNMSPSKASAPGLEYVCTMILYICPSVRQPKSRLQHLAWRASCTIHVQAAIVTLYGIAHDTAIVMALYSYYTVHIHVPITLNSRKSQNGCQIKLQVKMFLHASPTLHHRHHHHHRCYRFHLPCQLPLTHCVFAFCWQAQRC